MTTVGRTAPHIVAERSAERAGSLGYNAVNETKAVESASPAVIRMPSSHIGLWTWREAR